MAMIKCDKCGGMNDPKGFRKKHRTEGELEIDSFFCGSCGAEYIAFISDMELRAMISNIKRENLALKLMQQKKMTQKSIREKERQINKLRLQALDREKMLKNRYELEGKDGTTKETGISSQNPIQISEG